jgi:hypothetical protein
VRKRGGEDRAGIDELFANDIQPKIQTLQRPHPEQDEIIRLAEDHIVSSRGAAGVNDCIPNVALDAPPVRHHKALPSLDFDVE